MDNNHTGYATKISSTPRIGVVLLNWNNSDDTLRCLASLAASNYPNTQIVVIDNGSKDNSIEILRRDSSHIDLIQLPENLGYTGGNNVGIVYLLKNKADYVFLLNNDAIVEPDTLSNLASAAHQFPEAGFLGPKILFIEEPKVFLSAGGFIQDGYLALHRGIGEQDSGQYDQVTAADFVSGCALMVKRQVIEQIGLLDDDFFLYYEEVEWCQRGREAGFPAYYIPNARVWHPDTRKRDTGSETVTYYQTRNSLLFVRKTSAGWPILARMLYVYFRRLASWSIRPKWHGKTMQRIALRQALSDYFNGRFGKRNSGKKENIIQASQLTAT